MRGNQTGEKPVIYKGEKGWSTPSKGNTGSAWGQKRMCRSSRRRRIEMADTAGFRERDGIRRRLFGAVEEESCGVFAKGC